MAFTKTQHRLSSRDRLSTIHKRNIFILKILVGVVLFILFTTFVVATVQAGSESMEPTLDKGARALYHPLSSANRVKRGDILLVESPFYEQEHIIVNSLNRVVGFFTFQKMQVSFYPREGWINRYMIKRVVAVPGDTIKMEDWILYIKTADNPYYLSEFECSEKDYDIKIADLDIELNHGDPLSGDLPELTLNDGEFFVLGDNRRISNDSYYWGILEEDRVKGKLLFAYWPLSNFGLVR